MLNAMDPDESDHEELQNQHVLLLALLDALKMAAKDLQCNLLSLTNPDFSKSKTTFEALSKLEAEAGNLLSTDSNLFMVSQLLCNLNTLLEKLEKSQGYSLSSLLCRQISSYKISQVAFTIEAEIQAFLDRENVQILARTLKDSDADDDQKVKVLIEFRNRVCQGFNRDFQDLVLRAKVFSILETILCDSMCSNRVRDQAALVIDALARFNKNVFVGLVFMGPIVGALVSMGSCCSIQVLCSLIKFVRTPLIDEMESNGEIPRIINLLSSEELPIQAAALDCILELAYCGRKEVIEAMLGGELVEKLMELQRLEHGNEDLEKGQLSQTKNEGVCERDFVQNFPFEICVVRFAVQIEVGEGLNKVEKREVKLEILRRVRAASVSEAESATIEAEVLWGSSP
ncbi:hypothetical protein CMV_023940 [Castanea mollissima]|uniref:Uncharacterized protein n=1 Tax=Castanea mollissima TaxID=60419 RepID=A0A8J4QGH6_9ROSI|nr:hypothetical protein CMV_023940 [Castanea mollissima]